MGLSFLIECMYILQNIQKQNIFLTTQDTFHSGSKKKWTGF